MNSEYEYVDKKNQEVVRDLKATFFDILCRLEDFSSFLEQRILEESEESKKEQLQEILDSQDGWSDHFMQQVHVLTDFIQQFDFSLKRYGELENMDNDIAVGSLKEVVPDTIVSNAAEGDATLLDSETAVSDDDSSEDENGSLSSEENIEENDLQASNAGSDSQEIKDNDDDSSISATDAGDEEKEDTNLADTVVDSSNDENSSSDSLNDNDAGKLNDDSSSLETQDDTNSTIVPDASNLNLVSNDTAPLENSNTLVDSNTDADSTIVPDASTPEASASVEPSSPILPVQESVSVPVETQPLSASLPVINTVASTGSVSESNTLNLESPDASSVIDGGSDMPLPDIPIMRQMQNASSNAQENANSAVTQNNTSNISHSFQKANANLAKAILVTNKQYQKLLGSKDIQSSSLFHEKGEQSVLAQNISIEERRRQIEAMMEQANNLYKQGQTKEAQAMYDVISAMNQELQQAN